MVNDPVFSADGSRFGFLYSKGSKKYININGKAVRGPYTAASFIMDKNNVIKTAWIRADTIYFEDIAL